MFKKSVLCVASSLLLAGCINMPTKPAEITGAYTSELKYEPYSCDQLATETASLARREDQLVAALNQRYKTSEMQAFWLGFGQGDSAEASELATVRGEKEAVRKAIDSKHCATAH